MDDTLLHHERTKPGATALHAMPRDASSRPVTFGEADELAAVGLLPAWCG